MTPNRLVIISVDALNTKDHDFIKQLPAFSSFFNEGAMVREVSSVYPTITYTAHTSITTGRYPMYHGVWNNEFPQPEKAMTQDWHWYEHNIKAPTLFDYARKAGLTVGTLLWPCMAGAEVNWNVPEIWSPDNSRSGLSLFWSYGTRNLLFPLIRHSHLLDGKKQPALDNFTEAMAHHLLNRKKPHVTAIHFTELDAIRHIHGLDSSEAYESLRNIDQRITRLLETIDKTGYLDTTNLVLLGDHGTHSFTKVIKVNNWFLKRGLLATDDDGVITDWQVYACTCGGSCQIHFNRHHRDFNESVVKKALYDLVSLENSPIKALLTKAETQDEYGLSGDFDYVMEAADHHVFRNSAQGELITDRTMIPDCYKGDHGFLPSHEDMKTMLLMKGPDIKKGARLNSCSLVDEGPTFARLLNLTMEKTDGKVLSQLLNTIE